MYDHVSPLRPQQPRMFLTVVVIRGKYCKRDILSNSGIGCGGGGLNVYALNTTEHDFFVTIDRQLDIVNRTVSPIRGGKL